MTGSVFWPCGQGSWQPMAGHALGGGTGGGVQSPPGLLQVQSQGAHAVLGGQEGQAQAQPSGGAVILGAHWFGHSLPGRHGTATHWQAASPSQLGWSAWAKQLLGSSLLPTGEAALPLPTLPLLPMLGVETAPPEPQLHWHCGQLSPGKQAGQAQAQVPESTQPPLPSLPSHSQLVGGQV